MPDGDAGAQVAMSQSGEGVQIWLNGFVANPQMTRPISFVILLEDSEDLSRLLAIGQTLVQALDPH